MTPTPNRPTDDEIVRLERAFWDAMQTKDGARAAELSADGTLVTGPHGMMTVPKRKMSEMTEHGEWTLESYDFEDVEVRRPIDDVAIIAYTVRQQVVMNGTRQEMHAADSSTWVRGTRGWECHAHSESLLRQNA